MKKYFFLILLLVGLMACSTAPPQPEETFSPFASEVLASDNFVSCNAAILSQVWEVPGKTGDLVISIDELTEENNLYASLSTSTAYQETIEEVPEPASKFSLEAIISLILLVVTTVFGTVWRKAVGKLKQVIELLSAFHAALEDGNISKTEIADLKQKYYGLINKTV